MDRLSRRLAGLGYAAAAHRRDLVVNIPLVALRPISLLIILPLRVVDSDFPGNPLWAWEYHPVKPCKLQNLSSEIGRTSTVVALTSSRSHQMPLSVSKLTQQISMWQALIESCEPMLGRLQHMLKHVHLRVLVCCCYAPTRLSQ